MSENIAQIKFHVSGVEEKFMRTFSISWEKSFRRKKKGLFLNNVGVPSGKKSSERKKSLKNFVKFKVLVRLTKHLSFFSILILLLKIENI